MISPILTVNIGLIKLRIMSQETQNVTKSYEKSYEKLRCEVTVWSVPVLITGEFPKRWRGAWPGAFYFKK